MPARWHDHRRAAAPVRRRDVSGEGPRPQQLPALQSRHGPQAERAHVHRGEPALGARAETARRLLPARGGSRDQPRRDARGAGALEASVARLRRARALHQHRGGTGPHHADRRVRPRERDERCRTLAQCRLRARADRRERLSSAAAARQSA